MAVTCTGCALLCDDIDVIVENNKIKETRNTCRRGAARMKGCKNRLVPTVAGESTDLKSCIRKAAQIIQNAKTPMLFGLDNSTCEAQVQGIKLAKRLNAIIDDTSSFCQGLLFERVLQKKFRTCMLDDIRDKADVIVYWGSDVQDSQPRHMSRFSYFPRGKFRQRGYEEDRLAIAIDVRESNTAKICKGHFYRIPLAGDHEFIIALMDALSGKVPLYEPTKMLELAAIFKKAEFGAIFVGLGLTYSIKEDFDILIRLADMLPNIYIMPMVGHYNMRGFNEALFRETGFVNKIKFTETAVHDNKYAIVEALRNKIPDAIISIGSDPLSSLPGYISSKLASIPVICIDPCVTMTSKIAAVTIPCAISGVETGGTAIRMDGREIGLSKIIESDYASDEKILKDLMEAF